MARFVFKDKERTQLIYADKALREDMKIRYYCPNPYCGAEMYVCHGHGPKSPYFRATRKEHRHVENCPYSNSNNDFDPANYDEEAFIFDDAIARLLENNDAGQNNQGNAGNHREGEPHPHPPRTLIQIYSMCKSIPIEESYAGRRIYEMIIDDRSENYSAEDHAGNRIIECNGQKGYIYFDNCKEIRLKAPFESKNIKIILRFNDTGLYEKVKQEIYNNRKKMIVVAGDWEASDDSTLQTDFVNEQQLYIIKNN